MTLLNCYRRHGTHCAGNHTPGSTSHEGDERRRGWKNCSCPIYASGTIAGRFSRLNTNCTDWREADSLACAWEKSGSWDGRGKIEKPAPVAPKPAEGRTKIADAITAFLAVRKSSQIAPSTMRKYQSFSRQLRAFADDKGYVMLDQFRSADVDVFYANWKLGARSKGKALGTLRSFFRFCTNREWITRSPVSSDLKPPLGASRIANKMPFTDQELQAVINACDRLGITYWENGSKTGSWSGEDVKDFILLLTYSGLRISDASLFSMDRLRGNEVFLRAKKNGGNVFTWIPDWLVQRLRDRAKLHGPRPFIIGDSDKLETVTALWRRRINKVFALAGKFEDTPTPHKFRHTFARILLQRGVPVSDVADLLGDDEATIRAYYARWVPERQARLTNILQDAFSDKPRPNVIEMPQRSGT